MANYSYDANSVYSSEYNPKGDSANGFYGSQTPQATLNQQSQTGSPAAGTKNPYADILNYIQQPPAGGPIPATGLNPYVTKPPVDQNPGASPYQPPTWMPPANRPTLPPMNPNGPIGSITTNQPAGGPPPPYGTPPPPLPGGNPNGPATGFMSPPTQAMPPNGLPSAGGPFTATYSAATVENPDTGGGSPSGGTTPPPDTTTGTPPGGTLDPGFNTNKPPLSKTPQYTQPGQNTYDVINSLIKDNSGYSWLKDGSNPWIMAGYQQYQNTGGNQPFAIWLHQNHPEFDSQNPYLYDEIARSTGISSDTLNVIHGLVSKTPGYSWLLDGSNPWVMVGYQQYQNTGGTDPFAIWLQNNHADLAQQYGNPYYYDEVARQGKSTPDAFNNPQGGPGAPLSAAQTPQPITTIDPTTGRPTTTYPPPPPSTSTTTGGAAPTGTPSGSPSTPPGGAPPPGSITTPPPPPTTTTGTPPPPAGTTTPTQPPTQTDPNQLLSELRQLMAGEFGQEQSDMNRTLMAQLANTGGINSGGAQQALANANARLSADQGNRLSTYLQQANQSGLDRALQLYGINTTANTAQKQIDSNQVIAELQADTQKFGITTNADLQKYLDSQDNVLKKYGIDAQTVMSKYQADAQMAGYSASAGAQVNAALINQATQEAIAQKNSQTQLAINANNYNLGLSQLGLQQWEYQNPSFNSLLSAYVGLSPEQLAILGSGPLAGLLPSWMFGK